MDDQARLAKKLSRKPTAVLRSDEVALLVREARSALGPRFSVLVTERATLFEDLIRWGSLKARCEQVRAVRGITIKTAAARVGIPQYRIAAIECGRLRELTPEMAWKYFDFLGISPWVKKWVRANGELATRAGFAIERDGRKSNKRVNPSVRPVTGLANGARPAPVRPSGYAQR